MFIQAALLLSCGSRLDGSSVVLLVAEYPRPKTVNLMVIVVIVVPFLV